MPVTLLYTCNVDGRSVSSHFDVDKWDEGNYFETQDVFEHARQQIGAPHSARVNCYSIGTCDYTPSKSTSTAPDFVRHRMSRNCRAGGWNLRSVTSHNKFTCTYDGKGLLDTGQLASRPNMQWNGTLSSCDSGYDYMTISDSLVQDVQEMAYWMAGGEEAELDPKNFTCDIQSVPLV